MESAVAVLDPEPETAVGDAPPGRHLGAPAPIASPDIAPDDLSSLVATIYDSSLDPQLWPSVLNSCREFIGGHSASLYRKDLRGRGGCLYYTDGRMDPHYSRLYFERYAPLDPCNASHYFAEIEQPISTADMIDAEEFRDTRFYKEWVAPQGLVDFISVPLDKADGSVVIFGVFRHERHGIVDDLTRYRMRLLVPHVRRAVLIGKVIEHGNKQAASLGDALDGLAAGMFLVDARGRVVHANVAGSEMLSDGATVSVCDGCIVSLDRSAKATLAEVLSAAGSGDTAVGVRGISVAMLGRDGESHVAHVLPLTSGTRRRTGMSYAAVAALFIQRATLDTPAVPEVIAKTFGLTQSELRVLLGIVQIGGVAETAEALGIGEATVKTHLHRVFGKTGTSRQADLVKLVAGFASPFSR